jgi:hypothetical protein
MKIEKITTERSKQLMFCPSTNESFPFFGIPEIIKENKAFIAFWDEGHLDMPHIKDKDLKQAWKIFLKNSDKRKNSSKLIKTFLKTYENLEWKVIKCAFGFYTCTGGGITEDHYFVVNNDTVVIDRPVEGIITEPSDKTKEKGEKKAGRKKLIQVKEVHLPVNCPFCLELIYYVDKEIDCFNTEGSCEHLLFKATDNGFRYVSQSFIENMNLTVEEQKNLSRPTFRGDTIDVFTSKVTIPESIKYAAPESEGSTLKVYFGFAP